MNDYFFFSHKHHLHFAWCRKSGIDVSDTYVNGRPYTFWHSSKDDEIAKEYFEKWGDVEMVHEGDGIIRVKS